LPVFKTGAFDRSATHPALHCKDIAAPCSSDAAAMYPICNVSTTGAENPVDRGVDALLHAWQELLVDIQRDRGIRIAGVSEPGFRVPLFFSKTGAKLWPKS
jgi:hypothetical protein